MNAILIFIIITIIIVMVLLLIFRKKKSGHTNPSADLFGRTNADGKRLPPSIGESLMISAKGLAPSSIHEIELRDEQGILFTSRLITDRTGTIPESVLWPQFGLDDPHSHTIYSVYEAADRWRDKHLEVTIKHNKSVIINTRAKVGEFTQPLVMSVDRDNKMLNGFEFGKEAIIIAGYNVFHNDIVRVYIVEHQANWKNGNSIVPVLLNNQQPAYIDVQPDSSRSFITTIAGIGALRPGAYDFIARPLRYGYFDEDELIVRTTDIVAQRITGIVIRHEFWDYKVVRGGCVNMMPLSGRMLFGAPYFRYGDAFAEGEDIYAAVDPAALPPANIGKMAAIYVVQSKSSSQWDNDKSLSHLPSLGGNSDVTIFKTQAGCINHSCFLIWPNATLVGSYDIILDFGNNSSDAATFVPNNRYDILTPPAIGDIIDGYMTPGFRVVKDPGVITNPAYPFIGGFDYVSEGNATVTNENGATFSVDLTARVRFPSSLSGATNPAQISTNRSTYPMIIIVHGNGHSYEAYNYLLDHWAKNGFIAASIVLEDGQQATDRVRVLFAHIDKLKMKFGTRAENNIGIIGHSRGGEAVAITPRLNQTEGLGHNINAIISLAPTNMYTNESIVAPWAKDYYVIYGSLDGDVDGYGAVPILNSGFAIYDKAQGARKGMLFVYGGTHDRFLTPPSDPEFEFNFNLIRPSDQPKALSQDAHRKIALAYMTAYFRQNLLGDNQYVEMFKGEWVPPSVAMADSGKGKFYTQYRVAPDNRRTIDDFEETHTVNSWETSTPAGGNVSQSNLFADPSEDLLHTIDTRYSPHDTSGLSSRWSSGSGRLEFSIPPAQQDVSSFKAISFRVTQKYDPTGMINPLNSEQDFYVMLRDAGSQERMVKVSKFGTIPFPFVRSNSYWNPQISVIKSALRTIHIPLHAFTIECAGAQRVNLSTVQKLAFVFQANSSGEIEIDDIEFIL